MSNHILYTILVCFFICDSCQGSELIDMKYTHSGGSLYLDVDIENRKRSSICIDNDAFSYQSLKVEVRDGYLSGNNMIVGRPSPGCDVIEPGEVVSYTYNLSEIFDEEDMPGGKICFDFKWKYESEVDSQEKYQNFINSERECVNI